MNIIIFFVLGSTAALQLNKCCSSDQEYDYDNNDLTCISHDNETSPDYWLPDNFDKTLFGNFTVNTNKFPCAQTEGKSSNNFTLRRNGNSIMLDDHVNHVTLSEESFCLEKVFEGKYVFMCPCNEDLCWYKCCFKNEHLYRGNSSDKMRCIESENPDWNFELISGKNTKQFLTMHDQPDCEAMNKKMVHFTEEIETSEDGSITVEGIVIQRNEYCGDYFQEGDKLRQQTVLVCVDKNIFTIESNLYGFVGLFGAVLHLIIAFIYFWIPEIGGSPKWALAVQATCLFVTYSGLAYRKLIPMFLGENFCIFSGFFTHFSFLSSFFWLNVMCIDIARTFSGFQGTTDLQKKKENKKFIWYSMYSWGGSSIITLVTIVAEFSSILPPESRFKPNMLSGRCWFNDSKSLWAYVYIPICVILLFNLILFIYTMMKILKLKRESSALHQDNNTISNKKKQKGFILYLKIFLIMGVSWLTEIISWIFFSRNGLRFLWYITDMINILRIIYMFKIMCCTHKVWNALKNKTPWFVRLESLYLETFCNRKMDIKMDTSTTTTSTSKNKSDSEIANIQMQSISTSIHNSENEACSK